MDVALSIQNDSKWMESNHSQLLIIVGNGNCYWIFYMQSQGFSQVSNSVDDETHNILDVK